MICIELSYIIIIIIIIHKIVIKFRKEIKIKKYFIDNFFVDVFGIFKVFRVAYCSFAEKTFVKQSMMLE